MGTLGRPAARAPINTGDIPDNIITSAKIAADVLTAADIAPNAVTASELANDAVDTAAIAADAVDGTKIADNAIDSEHYAADSIDAEHYAAGSVDATAIGNDVVDSQHYAAASIDNEHLADDAVGVAELSATGTASATTFLRGDNSWVAAGSPSITDNGNANAMTIAVDETITHVEMSTFSKIWQNPNTISANITIASGYSAAAAGPINFTGTLAINGNLSII